MRQVQVYCLAWLGSVLLLACTVSDRIASVGERDAQASIELKDTGSSRRGATKFVRTASGLNVPHDAATQVLDTLARVLALSLNDESLRRHLVTALSQSTVRERKLEFGRFITAASPGLASMMSRQLDKSTEEFFATVASTAELEMYMPVPGHRESWNGDRNVQVAYQLMEGDSIVAYALGGTRSILSPDTPPDTPTIVLVSSETDFTRPMAAAECYGEQCDGGNDGGGTSGGPGAIYAHLYMTSLSLTDLHEGWPRGEPEIEVYVIGKHDNPVAPTARACSGESAPLPSHRFNMDDNVWSGSVKLANFQELGAILARDSALAFGVWEDDYVPCSIRDSGSWELSVIKAVAVLGLPPFLIFVVGPGPLDQCWDDYMQMWKPCKLQWYQYLSYMLSLTYMQDLIHDVLGAGDDFAGIGVSAAAWNQLMGANVQAPIVILDESGNAVGTMGIEFRTLSVPGN